MEDIATYADKVLALNHGEIILRGNPKKVFINALSLENNIIGLPKITQVTYKMIQKGINLSRPCLTVTEAKEIIMELYCGEEK